MKKRIFLALTAMLALSFVACGKDKGNNDTSGSDSSSVSVTTPAGYMFTKVINRAAGESVSEELEEGALLDLTAPAEVAGKTFAGWVYADGTAVEEGATMGTEALAIYATWDIQAYSVTVNLNGAEDKVYYFGVESVPATEETPEIIDIRSIGWVIANDYENTAVVTYTIEGLPTAEEGWKLQNYTLNVTSQYIAVSEALALGVANADKVTNGTLKLVSNGHVIDDITYKLADNYYYYDYIDDYGDTCKKWYIGYEGGILALQDMALGYVSKSLDELFAGMVNGYAFEYIINDTTYYGVESFISAIYALEGEKVESNENGVFSFSFTQASESTKNEFTVSFTLSDDAIINTVNVAINTYYANGEWNENDEYVYTGFDEEPDYAKVYTIAQATDGETVVDYDPAKVLVQDYNITDAEGEEVEELDVVAGQQVSLNMADVAEGVQLKWDTFTAIITDADGVEVDESYISVSVNAYGPTINVTGYIEGEYNVVIKSAYTTKTLTVSVELPETTEIMAKANEYSWSALTSAEIYADGALNFIVVANKYADASATVAVTTSPEGATPVIDEVDGDYTFTTDVAGAYVITITSTVDSTITSTIAVTVKEVPTLESILIGQFQNSDKTKDKQLSITMGFSNNMGQMIALLDIVTYNNWTGEKTGVEKKGACYVVAYDSENKSFTLTDAVTLNPSAANAIPEGYTYDDKLINAMMLTEDYKVKVYYNNMNQMTNLVPYAELTLADLVVGRYSCENEDGSTYNLQIWDDGTASLALIAFNSDYGYEQQVAGAQFTFSLSEDGVITVGEIGEEWPKAIEGFSAETTFTYDKDAGTITLVLGETTYVLS